MLKVSFRVNVSRETFFLASTHTSAVNKTGSLLFDSLPFLSCPSTNRAAQLFCSNPRHYNRISVSYLPVGQA